MRRQLTRSTLSAGNTSAVIDASESAETGLHRVCQACA
jgi:hypothetical protein